MLDKREQRSGHAPTNPSGRERRTRAKAGLYTSFKVIVDVTLACILFVLGMPLMLLAMALVVMTSSGPAIYSQRRVGRGRRSFTIYKIRTMYSDSESRTGPTWSTENDPRVTPVGRFLRRTHLDEWPQLWNVLRGEMSLVGPRPERPEFVHQLEQVIPNYLDRLLVRPGLTGLAQVNLPPDTDLESVRRKLVYDLDYVKYHGFWMDLRLLFATAFFLVGIPFARSRKLFWLAQLEGSYESVSASPPAVPTMTQVEPV
jgi:lipopolysaccharide/colanic/teichoic acid biosynthesis glycosyltransferase